MYGETRDAGFGPEVKRRIILGTFVLSSGYYDAYYLRAQKVRTLIRRDFEQAFAACDVVATPTTPTPAFRLGEKTDDPLQMYLADVFTVPANLAGIPGLSVPCGFVRRPAGRPAAPGPAVRRGDAAPRRPRVPAAHRAPPARPPRGYGLQPRPARRRRRSRNQRSAKYASVPQTTPRTVLPTTKGHRYGRRLATSSSR